MAILSKLKIRTQLRSIYKTKIKRVLSPTVISVLN